jgi:hypothetical protein
MLIKTVWLIIILTFGVLPSIEAAAWSAKGNSNKRSHSRANRTGSVQEPYSSPARFSVKPVEGGSRVYSELFTNDSSPSTRGRGSPSSVKSMSKESFGQSLQNEYGSRGLQSHRRIASVKQTARLDQQKSYSFTLNPNPSFSPFILQSNWGSDGDEDYEFKLFNPYSGGLFYQFGQ